MSKVSSLPAAVQQILEHLNDSSIPQHVKFNYVQTLMNIRDCCDVAIKKHSKVK